MEDTHNDPYKTYKMKKEIWKFHWWYINVNLKTAEENISESEDIATESFWNEKWNK
jgi:hypothetical protein